MLLVFYDYKCSCKFISIKYLQMKKTLIINHSNPFSIGGGSFASLAYIKAFSELLDGNIDICIISENKYPIDKTIKVN